MRLVKAACATLGLFAFVCTANASEVRLLTVGSTLIAAKAIAEDFTKMTGNTVSVTMRPPFDIDKALAESGFDVIILAVPAMSAHDKAGDIASASRAPLARVGVGVVVKEGAPVPDVSTADKLKAAVLAAHSITHSDPALPNTSGAVAAAAFAKLGILDALKEKTHLAPLQAGGQMVVKGEIEMGFFNVSEVPKGAVVAGPLPGALQSYTVYEAALMSKGSKDKDAAAFVKHLASPAMATVWQSAKLEPASATAAAPAVH